MDDVYKYEVNNYYIMSQNIFAHFHCDLQVHMVCPSYKS